ncbi:ABC transporter ATP-binding protein [Proteinivorax tanatarense]|uniref:ABC transporter ATP-binding protein n=1 Tax=Proteinivorax tanatarense TaxID=1260629 RepID=A0AAU7VNQ6_9FIRM
MKKYIQNHKLLLTSSVILVIFISITEAFQAILFQTIVDTATRNYNLGISTLAMYTIIFLIAVFVFESLSKISNAALNTSVMKDYKYSIINSFLSADNKSKLTSSELISIMNNDVKVIEDSYLNNLINIAKDLFLFVISLFLLFRINIYLTLSILVFGWVPIIVPQLFTKKNQFLKGKHLENLEKSVNKIKEIAQGFEVIKGFNIEKKIASIFSTINKEAEQAKFKSDAFKGVLGAISIVSGFLMFFVNVLIATYFVIQGDITIGQMMAAIQLMNYIVNPLISLSRYFTEIKSVSKVISNIQDKILNNNSISSLGKNEFSFNNNIEIKGLTYSYDNRDEVISNINYEFEKGKKYAIVGESGCGKTTFLKILMNQINDYQGEINIDDIEIKEIDPKSYYKKVTLVQQNVFMFKDTLKNNICLYNECTDEELSKAIRQSGLAKTIRLHEAGVETLVGEGKVELSGGELKRVAIARALIKDADIILVDEATSALDKITAHEIEKTLINLDSTMIAITHQMDETTLSKYDEILAMKDGKIVERGNLKELLDNKGHFYNIYNKKINDLKDEIDFALENPNMAQGG